LKLLLWCPIKRAKIHHLRTVFDLGLGVTTIDHDPCFGRNVSKGNNAKAFAPNFLNLPIEVLFAAFQLAPVLKKSLYEGLVKLRTT
jgi:hypothetical protein